MIKIHVVVDSPKWKKKIKNLKHYFNFKQKKFNNFNLSKIKKEFTIFLTSNYKMKYLHNKFRKINKPTDVLSFPLNIKLKNNIYIGDIAISYEIVNKRSKLSNFFIEFDKMWIHGYFHLIGYDHKKIDDHKKMLKKENAVLKYFHKLN